MSKYVKNLIMKDIQQRLGEIQSVAVINPRGIDATKTNKLRRKLHENKLKMTVVKNALAKRVLGDSKLKGFEQLLDGPSAVIYGEASVAKIARLLLDEKKTNEKLELRGIFFDGDLYAGDKGVETASKLPTREEAISNIAAAILGPGRKLAAAFKGPGGKLGGVLKAIEDKAPKGEAEAAPAGA